MVKAVFGIVEKDKKESEKVNVKEPWKCAICGHVNEDDGFFCEKCGARNIATYG